MRNSKQNGKHGAFQTIKKDQNNEPFENSALNGTPLNKGGENNIEDSYQNVNFERETNTLTMENVTSDIAHEDENKKFDKDIEENGLHDNRLKK